MKDILEELVYPIAGIFICIFFVVLALLAPVVYLQGRANAHYLKDTAGLVYPWYEAAFLEVKIHDASVNVETNR